MKLISSIKMMMMMMINRMVSLSEFSLLVQYSIFTIGFIVTNKRGVANGPSHGPKFHVLPPSFFCDTVSLIVSCKSQKTLGLSGKC